MSGLTSANTDPDFLEFAFSFKRFPRDGANRGHDRNPCIDALTGLIRVEMNQEKLKLCAAKCKKRLPKISLTGRHGSTTSFPSTDVLSSPFDSSSRGDYRRHPRAEQQICFSFLCANPASSALPFY